VLVLGLVFELEHVLLFLVLVLVLLELLQCIELKRWLCTMFQ
jgi:hypothetical protein